MEQLVFRPRDRATDVGHFAVHQFLHVIQERREELPQCLCLSEAGAAQVKILGAKLVVVQKVVDMVERPRSLRGKKND